MTPGRQLRALTAEEFERIANRLRHPPPGGRIEAAWKQGEDLTLLIEQLRLSPAERAERMMAVARQAETTRGTAQRVKSRKAK